jgi:hypothetical protein
MISESSNTSKRPFLDPPKEKGKFFLWILHPEKAHFDPSWDEWRVIWREYSTDILLQKESSKLAKVKEVSKTQI